MQRQISTAETTSHRSFRRKPSVRPPFSSVGTLPYLLSLCTGTLHVGSGQIRAEHHHIRAQAVQMQVD